MDHVEGERVPFHVAPKQEKDVAPLQSLPGGKTPLRLGPDLREELPGPNMERVYTQIIMDTWF